jgi:hypothetical protein
MTAGNQRESARFTLDRMATITDKHELNLSDENRPQIGLPGMIGCLVEQELENRVPLDKPRAALLTRTDKDRPKALLARGAISRGFPGAGLARHAL